MLQVVDLQLQVHLGCSQEERAAPQEVRVSLDLGFTESPPAESTDKLEQTICYAQLSEALKELVKCEEFCLVEKMARRFYETLKVNLPNSTFLRVRAHKAHPPVESLKGGVIYTCGDFLS